MTLPELLQSLNANLALFFYSEKVCSPKVINDRLYVWLKPVVSQSSVSPYSGFSSQIKHLGENIKEGCSQGEDDATEDTRYRWQGHHIGAP